MEEILDEVSAEVDFILKRHTSNLTRFRSQFGNRLDYSKYLELFEETVISARREIMEVSERALVASDGDAASMAARIQSILDESLAHFIQANKDN